MRLLDPCKNCGEALLTCPCPIEEEKQPTECHDCSGTGENEYGIVTDDDSRCETCNGQGYV